MTSSVDSRISPKRYESLLSEIEEEDQNIKSDLYELSVYDHILQISPGKTIQDEEIKDLVYCYVYAVKNDKVVQKLGVYERFTKEKEPFFDLSTFEKGTLCLFEKYETNPSLFLEFKSDPDAPKMEKTAKKSKKKSKAEPETKEEPVDLNEVDLNAPEAETKVEPEPEPETKEMDLNEVDLNAPEAEPEPEPEPEAETKEVEVDLNAPESKPSTPALLDVSELESNLGITTEPEPKKSKIKMKTKPKSSKIDSEPKAESKAEAKTEPETKTKPRTKKSKPIVMEAPGTKFG